MPGVIINAAIDKVSYTEIEHFIGTAPINTPERTSVQTLPEPNQVNMAGGLAGLERLPESFIVDTVAVDGPKQDGQVIVAVNQWGGCQDVLDPFLNGKRLVWKKHVKDPMMAVLWQPEQCAEANHGQETSQKLHAHA